MKLEEPELKATDLPALAAKDELRDLRYLAMIKIYYLEMRHLSYGLIRSQGTEQ